MLWIYFLVFAVLGIVVFLYAFRSLERGQEVEKRMVELQEMAEEEE